MSGVPPVSTALLRNVPLLCLLGDDELALLARVVTRKSYARGSQILGAGDPTDSLYILISGRIKVFMSDLDGKEVILSILEPNEFFGEMGLIDNSPRSASVVALEPCELICIAKPDFKHCLADNFEIAEIDRLKALHPGVPVMIYINSYAAAKARCDVCCTSANSVKIAREMPGEKIIFVPDILFAENLAQDLKGVKEVIYPGRDSDTRGAVCEVHEKFTLEDLLAVRKSFDMPKGHPNKLIYAHWECKPDVLREADFYGSTTQISRDIARRVDEGTLQRAFVASECELTSNLAQEFPGVQFSTACSVRCQHMAKMTLEGILDILRRLDSRGDLSSYEVKLDSEIMEKAREPIERMLQMS